MQPAFTAEVASSGPHSHKTLLQPFSAKIFESIFGSSEGTFLINTFLGILFRFPSLAVEESYTTKAVSYTHLTLPTR